MYYFLITNQDAALGYVSLSEMESIKRPFDLAIERDMYFMQKPLNECLGCGSRQI